MTRGQLRALFQRQVNDVSAHEWADADANSLLNDAYMLVQKEIFKHDPEAHLAWDYMDTQDGVNWYALPPSFGLSGIGIKSTSTDTAYAELHKARWRAIRSNPSTFQAHYCRRGQFFGVFPAPTESITNGIEIIHTPILSMSADEEVPKIKVPLHLAIVFWAKLIALQDTSEDDGTARSRLGELLADLPQWYQVDSDEADRLSVSGYSKGVRSVRVDHTSAMGPDDWD